MKHAMAFKVFLSTSITLLILSFSIAANAETSPSSQSHCNTQFVPPHLLAPQPDKKAMPLKGGIDVTADKALVEKGKAYHFEGKVQLKQSNQILNAIEADYYEDENQIHARGSIHFITEKQVITGSRAKVNLETDTAEIENPEFWLLQSHLRGEADSVDIEKRNSMTLKNVKFTSCDKEDEVWVLRASELQLNHEENEGIAYHARIEFMSVPFVYLPYLSFPLEGRKTGFLVPSIGDSTSSGAELSVPYYFNIAPNHDATFTPKYLEKRGILYIGEYRYFFQNSAGQVDLEMLQDDDIKKEDRLYGSYFHQGKPAEGWTTDVSYRYVSDASYFEDFSNNLTTSSLTHLERHVDVNYQAERWSVKSKIQYFQTVDDTIPVASEPYQRRPQFQFAFNPYDVGAGVEASANAEYVNFYRSAGTTGIRTDLVPQIGWPYRANAGFFQPSLKLRHTRYDLQEQNPAYESKTSRTLPMFSVDSGLFFERNVFTDEEGTIQTLEPRLYYLYVPYRDQDNLIVDPNGNPITFDSSLPQFSFSELFRDNRFSGADRVGDANQLSASVTSKFINDSGEELVSASIGQILYFENRDVVLPNGNPETRSQSDLAAELKASWKNRFDASASVLWDERESEVYRGSLQFRYQHDRDKIGHLSYRFERDSIRQADVSALWRLNPQWKAVWRWYYSFLDNKKLENVVGVEYESCCWAIRLVQRDYISDFEIDDETRNKSIWVQLELKGMASVGKKVDTAFETGLFSQ
jgi:LPS-assembly protein